MHKSKASWAVLLAATKPIMPIVCLRRPAGLPHQQKEMASGETCQDVDDADSTCSGVWFRGQRADSSNDLPEAASSMHFTPARSQADLTTRIMTEGQAPFAKSANPSHSSAVSKSNAQTPGGPVVGAYEDVLTFQCRFQMFLLFDVTDILLCCLVRYGLYMG